MPLKKLWNALRGQSATPSQAHSSATPSSSAQGNSSSRGHSSTARADSSQAEDDARLQTSNSAVPKSKAAAAKKRAGSTKLGLFGGGANAVFGGGPHAGLCKQLKSVPASRVLEIGVDDGSRAAAVIRTLAKKGRVDVEYLAIDQFELSGHTELKNFHRQLRAHQIRARLFPHSIAEGLTQVSHTIGAVDLVIIAAAPEKWQNPQVESALARVCHGATVVFWLDGETWQRLDRSSRRAA